MRRPAPLVGIGVSVPGLVRRSDGLIRLAPNLELDTTCPSPASCWPPSASTSRSRWPTTPTSARWPSTGAGSGVGIDDLIYVSGNVGVGAGVITGGRPARGRRRLRRRGRAPALQPRRPPVPLRQPRAAGRPRSARTPSPRPSAARSREVAQLGDVLGRRSAPRRASCARTGTALGQGLAEHRQRVQPRSSWCSAATSARSTRWCAPRSTPGSPSGPCPRRWSRSRSPAGPRRRLGAAGCGRDRLRAALRRPGGRARRRAGRRRAPGSPADAGQTAAGEHVGEGLLGRAQGGGLDAQRSRAAARVGTCTAEASRASSTCGPARAPARPAARSSRRARPPRGPARRPGWRGRARRRGPTRVSTSRVAGSVSARAATAARGLARGCRARACRRAASTACRPIEASQQPRRPQPHAASGSPTGMWPTSPANPLAPVHQAAVDDDPGPDADGPGEVERVRRRRARPRGGPRRTPRSWRRC